MIDLDDINHVHRLTVIPSSPPSYTHAHTQTHTHTHTRRYDCRCLITGDPRVPGATGLFDAGSFTETLGGWAKTVVTGRARLGGIPIGVIAVETRAIEMVTPADPANMDSVAQVSQQAGQVWYPNSAYKTATAIKDVDKEGIPLFILANWRGFSGGMRDMYVLPIQVPTERT